MKLRYRITYKKNQAMRYTSSLDLHKVWERSFRRANLPLAYSQGYHPQPKLQPAISLPLGFLGENELLDIYLTEEVPLLDLMQRISSNVPNGLEILSVSQVLENEPALQVQAMSSYYRVILLEPQDENVIQSNIDLFLSSTSLIRERRGKQYDLRPLVYDIKIQKNTTPLELWIHLCTKESASGRPEEVLSVLGIPFQLTRIIRIEILLSKT
jgi:radical SAM-linked protein